MSDKPTFVCADPLNSPNPTVTALSLVSLLDGAMDRGLVAGRDEAITCALIAALTFAIDSHAHGAEAKALKRTQTLFKELLADFNEGIESGTIRGGRRGGYERR